MKNKILIPLLGFAALACGSLLAACVNPQGVPECTHQNSIWRSTQVLHELYCVDCGTVLEEDVHNFSDGSCIECGTDYNLYLDNFNGTYGYDYFGTLPKGEGLQALYRDIDESVREFHNSGLDIAADGNGQYKFATINYVDYGLTQDEAKSVWKTYHDDKPLYYWLSNTVGSNQSVIALFCLNEYADGKVRSEQNLFIYSQVGELLKMADGQTSAYAYAFAFHDAVIGRIDYSASDENGNAADWAHNICGVLEGKGAVCEGYARSFQLLLNVCGVQNVFVTGSNHAWNLVKLDDGNWYWYDLTWDDAPNTAYGVLYNYFCVTDEDFLQSHTPDSYLAEGKNFLYKLPERAQNAYSSDEILYNSCFTIESVSYTVVGYGLVTSSDGTEAETVEYKGITYKVMNN